MAGSYRNYSIKIIRHSLSSWWLSRVNEFSRKHRKTHGEIWDEEVLETIYGPNAVLHILSGKAYACSLRGHLLLQSALEVIILQLNNCLNIDLKDMPVFEPDPVLESVF